jgi:hypothetical protein
MIILKWMDSNGSNYCLKSTFCGEDSNVSNVTITRKFLRKLCTSSLFRKYSLYDSDLNTLPFGWQLYQSLGRSLQRSLNMKTTSISSDRTVWNCGQGEAYFTLKISQILLHIKMLLNICPWSSYCKLITHIFRFEMDFVKLSVHRLIDLQ